MNQNAGVGADVAPAIGSRIGLRRETSGEWIVATNGEENRYQTLGAALDSLRARGNLAPAASTAEITKLQEENQKLRDCVVWLTMTTFEKEGDD